MSESIRRGHVLRKIDPIPVPPVGRSGQQVYYDGMEQDMASGRPPIPKWLSDPLTAGILAYLGLFLAYYPPIAGIEDEQGFVNQAIFWAYGGLSAEAAGLPTTLGDLVEVDGRHLPARHPGRSLVALPFYAAGGYHGVFLSGAFLHVVLTLLAAATFWRLGFSIWWAVLVLFHPTLSIYSRTVMADAPAGMGLLISVFALAGADKPRMRDLVLAGLGVSLAAAMRHHAVAALPAIAVAAWLRCGSRRSAAVVLVASAVGAVPMIVFNLAAYGSIFDPFSAGRGSFGIQYLPDQLLFYAEALSLFWPLMFFAPLLCRGPVRWVTAGICSTFLALLGCYYYHDKGGTRIQTDVVGLRLMQVALPAWIIAYGVVLGSLGNRYLSVIKRDRRIGLGLAWAVAILGTVLTTGIFDAHQNRLANLNERRQEILATTPDGAFVLYEGVVAKLMGIYREDQPNYRFHPVSFLGQYAYTPSVIRAAIAGGGPVRLVFSPKNEGEQMTPTFRDLIEKLDAVQLPSVNRFVHVWTPRRNLPEDP